MKFTKTEIISERVNVIAKVTLLQIERCLLAISNKVADNQDEPELNLKKSLTDIAEVVYSVQSALDTAAFWMLDYKSDDRVKKLTQSALKLNPIAKSLKLPEDDHNGYLAHFIKQNKKDGLIRHRD
ncbi:hypothetical protein [Rhodoferax mekongensis]|uniref:Uncharacterized protein n=1 Tax=Rhodoferax mekongensis TaxID=3068341 RepID=A0ABZ0AYY0_9BURK|nr:hypothetical protein [Rhodoferax sp. TBRC 17307]WNO03917.1 hypothetical protein RAN89_13475 [Rhodoferax sp. TBRC 17307]